MSARGIWQCSRRLCPLSHRGHSLVYPIVCTLCFLDSLERLDRWCQRKVQGANGLLRRGEYCSRRLGNHRQGLVIHICRVARGVRLVRYRTRLAQLLLGRSCLQHHSLVARSQQGVCRPLSAESRCPRVWLCRERGIRCLSLLYGKMA